jgi:hypothetical protein
MNLDAEGADTQNSDTRFPFGALQEPSTSGEDSGIVKADTEGLNPPIHCSLSRGVAKILYP